MYNMQNMKILREDFYMEFRDLKKQYETLKSSIDASIQNVINNTAFISGPQVKELEDQLASYVGRKHCITCGNGTDALSMVLMAWVSNQETAYSVPVLHSLLLGKWYLLKVRPRYSLMSKKIHLIWIRENWKSNSGGSH